MITVNCPRCEREFEVDETDGNKMAIIPVFKKCECGESYSIIYDCDDEYDAVLIADFFEYNK
jgi:hypothetical protein